MNPFLAIGQIIVSIALIAAILLQARGTGLSGTFGGDSAVYRSRRGVERRLWQFTIVLLVALRRLLARVLHPRARRRRLTAGAARRGSPPRHPHGAPMTRTDAFVVGTLVVLLALVAGLIGVPALQSRPRPRRLADRRRLADPAPSAVRRGALGAPVSVSPLTARTQADRDLVALIFAGLVRNGPDGTDRARPRELWSVDADRAGRGRSTIRDDATWHDGEPVTADDVAVHDPDAPGSRPTPARPRRRGARSTVAPPTPRHGRPSP